MSLETLPSLREALETHGLWAKKAFGQHFLLDLNITRKIARLAEVGAGERRLVRLQGVGEHQPQVRRGRGQLFEQRPEPRVLLDRDDLRAGLQ